MPEGLYLDPSAERRAMSPAQRELLRTVQWADLLHLRKRDIVHELLLSSPWLLGSLLIADSGQYLVALGCCSCSSWPGCGRYITRFMVRLAFPDSPLTMSCWCSAWRCWARCTPCK